MIVTIRMKGADALEFYDVVSLDTEHPHYVQIYTEIEDEIFLVPWINIVQITMEPSVDQED